VRFVVDKVMGQVFVKKIQQDAKMYQIFIISYLYEPSTYEKPKAASAVLGS